MILKRPHLAAWQWSLYPDGHRDRVNLIIHAASVPVFVLGFAALWLGPWVLGWRAAVGGVAMMAGAMIAQGRGHRRETTAPVPFEGPVDVLSRIVTEQLVTFPRYVLSGRFGRALTGNRAAADNAHRAAP